MTEFLPLAIRDHPLIAAILGVVYRVILLLGALHVLRLFLRFLLILVEEVKHELSGIGDWLRRLTTALTKWKG